MADRPSDNATVPAKGKKGAAKSEVTVPAKGKFDMVTRQAIVDVVYAHQVYAADESEVDPTFIPTVKLYAGLRYVYLRQTIDPAQASRLGGSEDWVEPVIGTQILMPVAERWDATLRADISGFGVGSASDKTTNFLVGGGYNTEGGAALLFGYKWYDIDYSKGSGSNEFGLDGTFDGPYLAYVFRF